MDHHFLPSVSGLLAFESVARHGSITLAASELYLTQSAVSRQIRQLEEFLDVELFHRVHQRVHLTEAGRHYLKDVAKTLAELGSATSRIMTRGESARILTFAVPSALMASRWLIPRLPSFIGSVPKVELRIAIKPSPFESSLESADLAIQYGDLDWVGASIFRLMDEILIPVCSPSFRDEYCIREPRDLARVPLLHEQNCTGAWPEWFGNLGSTEAHASRGSYLEEWSVVLQAAVSGIGAALLPSFLIQEELSNGALVQPVNVTLKTTKCYHLVIPATSATSPVVKELKDCLLNEARALARKSEKSLGNPAAVSGWKQPAAHRTARAKWEEAAPKSASPLASDASI